MRLSRTLPLVVLLAVLVMAGCSGSDPGPEEGGTSDSPSSPAVIDPQGLPTTTRGLVTTVANRFEFVDYQTSGGLTGVSKWLKVWPDGRAVCSKGADRVDFSVSAPTVTELRTALEAANLPALPAVNGTQTPDATVSRVIFGGQSVRFVSGSMPPALGPAVAILDRLLARGCP